MLRRATTLVLLACALALGTSSGSAAAATTAARTVVAQSAAQGDPCGRPHANPCTQIPEAPFALLFPLAAVAVVGVAFALQSRRRRPETRG